LSLDENDQVSSERVDAILQALRKNPPPRRRAVLRQWRRRLERELQARRAVIEHAGPLDAATVESIVSGLSERYGRPLQPITRENPTLISGLRVRVGDDLYDASIEGRLKRMSQHKSAA
jgi:F-type H+-transporting ATPase subunit delta